MHEPLSIAGLTVPPGEERRGTVKLLELADGSAVACPLRVLHGAFEGPRLYLGAAIHGDEVNGVAILARALAASSASRSSTPSRSRPTIGSLSRRS